jgi:hypothetical protein
MSWRLAQSLKQLRIQINAAAPHRSKASDGSIGDARHQALGDASDHNPWIKNNGVGIVTAVDVTHDPANGVDGTTLSRALIVDPRTKYVIFNGEIWKARTGQWEPYRKANQHKTHVHVSVKPDRYDNTEPWPLSLMPKKVLRKGDQGDDVLELQVKLRKELDVPTDGIFSDDLERLVKIYQRSEDLEPDGMVGPKTRKALGL